VKNAPRLLAAAAPLAVSVAVLTTASPARADASAWAFFGGGAMAWKQSENPSLQPAATMIIDGGVGSSPDGRVIIGGIFRFQPVFNFNAYNVGVDLAVLARLCTHGFQTGGWGFAVDAGGFARPWGSESVGFTGSISLGMPLGITLMGTTQYGVDGAVSFGAVAGIDLLRLTLYRQTLLKWWQNPSSSGGQTARGGLSFLF
jgi:hypothetical protein